MTNTIALSLLFLKHIFLSLANKGSDPTYHAAYICANLNLPYITMMIIIALPLHNKS
jgi:hypothetical protein